MSPAQHNRGPVPRRRAAPRSTELSARPTRWISSGHAVQRGQHLACVRGSPGRSPGPDGSGVGRLSQSRRIAPRHPERQSQGTLRALGHQRTLRALSDGAAVQTPLRQPQVAERGADRLVQPCIPREHGDPPSRPTPPPIIRAPSAPAAVKRRPTPPLPPRQEILAVHPLARRGTLQQRPIRPTWPRAAAPRPQDLWFS